MTLVDSSSWIQALRKTGDESVRQRVHALLSTGEAAWCDLVRLELWNGAPGEAEKKALRQFDRDLPCLETSREVWDLACELARKSRTAGLTVPATDLVIFACAQHHGVALEHRDQHFDLLQRLLAEQSPPASR